MPNDHTIRYLEMGSCYNGYSSYGFYKEWLSCAWDPVDCDLTVSGNSFVGTDQDEDFIKQCNPNDQPIGRCLLEDKCALRASDCGTGFSAIYTNFRADDPACTIQRDKAKEWDVDNPQFTQFGSCLDNVSGEHFCVYNPTDCDESGTEEYVNAAATLALGVVCDCSEVHVSSCVTDSKRAFCAINAEGCRPTWPHYSPHTQRLHRDPNYSGGALPTPGLDCRLCRKKNTPSPTSSPTTLLKPTNIPTSIPTALPTTQSQTQSPTLRTPQSQSPTDVSALKIEKSEENEKSFIIGAAVGGSIAAVAFIGILATIYVKMFRNQNERIARKKRSSRSRPPKDIFTEN